MLRKMEEKKYPFWHPLYVPPMREAVVINRIEKNKVKKLKVKLKEI